jgi:hypothetical protein
MYVQDATAAKATVTTSSPSAGGSGAHKAAPVGPHGARIILLGAPVERVVAVREAGSIPTAKMNVTEQSEPEAEQALLSNTPQAQLRRESDRFRASHRQRLMLVHVAHNPAVQRYLVEHSDMPKSLLESCIYWSGLQMSLYEHGSDDSELLMNIREPLARKLYLFVKALLKWYEHRQDALSMLQMPPVTHADMPSSGGGAAAAAVADTRRPRCFCDRESVRKGQMSEGLHSGRVYYGCGNSDAATGNPACVYFQWADEVERECARPAYKSRRNSSIFSSFQPQLELDEKSDAPFEKGIEFIDTSADAWVSMRVRCSLQHVAKATVPSAEALDASQTEGAVAESTSQTSAYDAGLPNVPYDTTYDSDDSDDSMNERKMKSAANDAAADVDAADNGNDSD